jgi:putative FmdB family regulatory protein
MSVVGPFSVTMIRAAFRLFASADGSKHEALRWHRGLIMPVYEFACRDCQKTFEIVRPISESSSANVTCTHCGSTKVERIFSTVYAVTSKKS